MATYEYVCRDCGYFDVRLPMGTAPSGYGCATCGHEARRVYSPPNISWVSPALAAAFGREEQSRDAPEVVTTPPPGRRRSRPPHPALARLPRP
ncbi:FmdB family zinc ribbon protein [Streptosporangium saharense]|uniref:FmdB family zinc ribbon protein n=1 Tax=Streptosporangium saharense TaxID=1706840 RepID=UPI0034122C5A